jgi:hypothetical protein
MRQATHLAFLVFAFSVVAFAQADIHKIDFKNFTHSVHCIGESPENITVKNGEYSKEKQEDGYVDRFYFNIFNVTYGDVTGDGKDDAIVLGSCNTGGTGNFSEGFVYTMKGTKAALVGRIPGGDRAYGGLRTANAAGGLLVVESNDVGEEGGACCPQYILTTKYKLAAGKLQKVGAALKEPIDRMERVSFEKGKSESTFKVFVPGSDSKKFVVGARAGQTMWISVAGDAAIKVLTAARTTESEASVKAVLPKNGDYVFEITNNSATENEVTVTVRIQ